MSVRLPPDSLEHEVRNVRGLMLAAALKPEALALLLGCTIHEANAYRSHSLGRMERLKARIRHARGI